MIFALSTNATIVWLAFFVLCGVVAVFGNNGGKPDGGATVPVHPCASDDPETVL